MVEKSTTKRTRGRPREFIPEEALDRAVELFWADGFEGVDVDRIARAVGVTKPSLYRVFGDKASLFLHALRRYGETIGAAPLAAFHAEQDVADAVGALLRASVQAGTMDDRPKGCLIACVAMVRAQHSPEIQAGVKQGLAALASILETRFEAELKTGMISHRPSTQARSRLTVDLMQGLLLRARAGTSREELLDDVQSYVPLILR